MNNIISIVIPTYNRAHSLPEAIQSVLDQSVGNWELIIVDDGSTDDTRNIIDQYLTDERIYYFFQQNAGVSAARNKGIDLSTGDYLIFLDSDDHFLPGLLLTLNEIKFSRYDLICWQVLKMIDGKTSVWKPQKLEKIYNNVIATFLAGSICYKKDIVLEAGKFDPGMTFGENYELGLRISQKEDLKIKILDKEFLYYSINTKKRESNSLDNRLESLQLLYFKHQIIYQKDRRSHGKIKYLLGYVNEKLGKRDEASKYYQSAFLVNPFNFKALLKSLYFNISG